MVHDPVVYAVVERTLAGYVSVTQEKELVQREL